MFFDRNDAGKQLAEIINKCQINSPIVLAVSDGGIPVGIEVAKRINAQFSLLMVQKLPFPDSRKSEFGAIAEDDSMFLLPAAAATLDLDTIKSIVEGQKREIERRIKILRGNRPLPELSEEVVILISDGIVSGSIIYAAINLCRKRTPNKIIVSSPVCSPEVARSFEQISDVDQTIILNAPKYFRRVSQVYENWREFTEYEALAIMQQWQRNG